MQHTSAIVVPSHISPAFGGPYQWEGPKTAPRLTLVPKKGTMHDALGLGVPLRNAERVEVDLTETVVSENPIYDQVKQAAKQAATGQPGLVVAEPVQPENLAEALKANTPGFEDALRDPSIGHRFVANAFPFTSESSVRRWRKSNGVEVAK